MSEHEPQIDLGKMYGGIAQERHASKKEKKKHRVGGGKPPEIEVMQDEDKEFQENQSTENATDEVKIDEYRTELERRARLAGLKDKDFPKDNLDLLDIVEALEDPKRRSYDPKVRSQLKEKLQTMGYHPRQTHSKSVSELTQMLQVTDKGEILADFKQFNHAYKTLRALGIPSRKLDIKSTEVINLYNSLPEAEKQRTSELIQTKEDVLAEKKRKREIRRDAKSQVKVVRAEPVVVNEKSKWIEQQGKGYLTTDQIEELKKVSNNPNQLRQKALEFRGPELRAKEAEVQEKIKFKALKSSAWKMGFSEGWLRNKARTPMEVENKISQSKTEIRTSPDKYGFTKEEVDAVLNSRVGSQENWNKLLPKFEKVNETLFGPQFEQHDFIQKPVPQNTTDIADIKILIAEARTRGIPERQIAGSRAEDLRKMLGIDEPKQEYEQKEPEVKFEPTAEDKRKEKENRKEELAQEKEITQDDLRELALRAQKTVPPEIYFRLRNLPPEKMKSLFEEALLKYSVIRREEVTADLIKLGAAKKEYLDKLSDEQLQELAFKRAWSIRYRASVTLSPEEIIKAQEQPEPVLALAWAIKEKEKNKGKIQSYRIKNQPTATEEQANALYGMDPYEVEQYKTRDEFTPKVPVESEKPPARAEVKEKTAEKKKLYAAELSDYVDAYARRQAQEKFREVYDKSRFARMWLHPLENYFIGKFYNEARESIEKNKNLMTLLEARVTGKVSAAEGDEKESYLVMDAIIEAYIQDLGIKEGEKAEKVEDEKMGEKLGTLLYLNVKNNWTRKQFNEELSEVLKHIYKSKSDKQDEGKVFASNIWQYAESYRYQISELITKYGPENEQALKEHINGLMNVDLYLGRKDSDIRKEPKKLGKIDQLIANAQSTRIGGLIANPFVMGVVTSVIGRSVARRGLRAGLTTATAVFVAPTMAGVLGPLLAGAAAGAGFAALRRNKEVKQDFTQERIQQALGREAAGERAAKVREFILEMKDASVVAAELSKPDVSKEYVADIIARDDLERIQGNQEFFKASSENKRLGTRQLDLNKMYAALKDVRSRPEFSDAALEEFINTSKNDILRELDEKEIAFKEFKSSQKRRAAIQGAISGIVGGVIAQEGIALTKDLLGIEPGDTLIRKTARYIGGDWHKNYFEGAMQPHGLSGIDASVHTAPGFDIADHKNGTADLLYEGKAVANGLKYDSHGMLAKESQDMLRQKGFLVYDYHDKVTIDVVTAAGIVETTPHPATLEELKTNFGDSEWGIHKRADWHNQGEQYSSFYDKIIEHPGKEQMLYLNKDASGRVVVDAHKIIENFKSNVLALNKESFMNPDGSYDNKMSELFDKFTEWNEKGELGQHLQAVILPDKGSAVSTVFTGDASGRISLSESLSKLVTEPRDGKLPFMIELRLDDGHVLATAQGGQGIVFKDVFEHAASKITKTIETIHTYIRPEILNDMEPAIATSIAKRYHLEPLTGEMKTKRTAYISASGKTAQTSKAIDDLELNSLVPPSDEDLSDLPLGSERKTSAEIPEEKLEEQMDLPEDMRIRQSEEIKDKEKIPKLDLLHETIVNALAIYPHLKTKKDFETILDANYELFKKSDPVTAKTNFKLFMKENFAVLPNEWHWTKKSDKIKLEDRRNIVPILKDFQQRTELAQAVGQQLRDAQKALIKGQLPRMRINLLQNRAQKPNVEQLPKTEN